MREKFVANVPADIFDGGRIPEKGKWEQSFNVAGWIRFRVPCSNQLVLLVKYADKQGVKIAQIDNCSIQMDTTALLSGMITLQGVGKISEMGIFIQMSESDSPFVFDELYVQSTNNVKSGQKLISA